MLEFREVSFAYAGPDGGTSALRDVTLTLAEGELVALLGRNGSGKSTLTLMANGLLLPSSGEVLVDGMNTSAEETLWDVRGRVGVVLQNPDNQIVSTFVEEDVAFGPENLGIPRSEIRERVDNALAAVGLAGMEQREPHTLSGGQKQRLAIAGALALQPTFLVLDEPTAMLDPEGRTDVLDVIEAQGREGRGVLHVTHSLSDASRADRIVVLDSGSVAFDGSPTALLADPSRLIELGLAMPPFGIMADELRRLGAPVPPGVMDPDVLAEALWPSV